MVDIRAGTIGDAPAVLCLYDAAVAWLAAAGRSGQWGAAPFSAQPHLVAQIYQVAGSGQLRVADTGAGLAGAMWLGPAPRYAPPADRPEFYLHGLVVDRARKGEGVGHALINHAIREAAGQRAMQLRLDCWGGGDRALIHYYEHVGFHVLGEATLSTGWNAVFMARDV